MAKTKLTKLQIAFAKEVVKNGGDKVAAYKKAGYSMAMSDAAIAVQADKFYNHPKIALKISELQALKNEVAKKEFGIDAKWLLGRLKQIDDLDILDIMNDDITAFRPLSEWPKVWRTSISGLDVMTISNGDDIEQIVKKIKWPDKVKNLEMIGRHVSVKAWDKEIEKTSDSMADSISKLIDKLPN